ncbi:3-deoxy-D-manno-octulosonic-acid transferase [Octadecabacter temperatus]|uniref:3-deoxy-D-manno-octulosonic acid transferase n=1 Tax=Octadecabacter temperatus TaxID=1458307 RepID=A0A0K0Y9K1_9RHOB|nr:glycosyltransferase N-terminal domain-containing protein [Octadecabacter temperatus]AKS47590.1 3-deoxy-D-manno-octulosonic acid transferase [Octadecabacter temperatus]SIO40896.1 3-deoxy-D-manno-octulosonic-acid transferase [Octadecabacter temperatus]
MIWVHCGDADEVTTTLSLAIRLLDHNDVLITASEDILPSFVDVPDGVEVVQVPNDTPARTRDFLARWQPQFLIWNGGPIRPVLLRLVAKNEIGAALINARVSTLFTGGSRWLPGASRNAAVPFSRILTADGATATRLIRGGVARDKVTAAGPILEEPIALPHDQYELTVLVETLGTRPFWFAADVVPNEVKHMAAAHLSASRKSHRLLMIIAPRDVDSGQQIAETLREAGLKVGVRSQGDNPMPEQQAYVADIEGELGLWYRVAPLTFMGGTLGSGDAVSPFEPIVLGSAIIHGPRKVPHEARYARLAEAQACREIRTAGELGIAVGALISPEQTARMAMAGWAEITHNAEVINTLVQDAVRHCENAGDTQ